jgi:hypothetical protein
MMNLAYEWNYYCVLGNHLGIDILVGEEMTASSGG